MKRRVKIISMPKAQSGLEIKMNPGMGFNANQLSWPVMAGEFSEPNVGVKKTLKKADGPANLEAEDGETVVTNLNDDGIPEFYKIGGERHYNGGTPLNLPPNSFIFSRDKSMKIKDEDVLKMFTKGYKRGGYTPADISKQYDINDFRKVLADPDSDDLQRKTAEMMIANYNLKLGKLALVQESKKGFPQGIPEISMPYLENMRMNPEEFIQTQGEKDNSGEENMAKYGKEVLPKAQFGRHRVRVIYPPGGGNMYPMYPMYPTYGQPGYVQPQGGGTTTTTTTPTKKQEIPKDAQVIKRSDYKTEEEYIAARNKAFVDAKGKSVYTQGADGKYYTVGSKPLVTDLQSNLDYMRQSFSDPKVAEAFKQKIVDAYDAEGNLGSRVKGSLTKEQIQAMEPQVLVDHFLQLNERNLKTNDLIKGSYDCFDNATGVKIKGKCEDLPYNSLDEVFVAAGVPKPADDATIGLQQLTYIGYKDLLDDNKAGKISDKYVSDKLNPFDVSQLGVDDETVARGKGKVSKADAFYTNTSAGQVGVIKGSDYEETLVPDTETEETKTTKNMGPTYMQEKNAPWWLQDIIKTAGAFGDQMRVKKYMPWQATPAVYLPEAVLADPNRMLAANAEQANIMAQNLAAFSGPKALSSRTSQIQGQAAKTAADTLSQYANMNVGTVNNLENIRANIMNQAAQNRAGLATQLYDKNTIANQQFDNAKNLARQNLRQSYIDAITNKEMTYNLNQLFPQYQVHPEWGGGIEFDQGRPLTPTDPNSQEVALGKYKQYRHQLPGVEDATIWNLVKSDLGQGTADASNPNMDYLKMLMASQGQV